MWSSSFFSDYSADLYLNQNDWVVVAFKYLIAKLGNNSNWVSSVSESESGHKKSFNCC